MSKNSFVLGAGMTGLAAGFASGLSVFEDSDSPGGICSSYYVRPGEKERLSEVPSDDEAYRFEIGGGHWIFGAGPAVLQFIQELTSVKKYSRLSSVYFREKKLYVPYPLQNHLRFFDETIAAQALTEMVRCDATFRTMKEWLERSFGTTLCGMFFFPFHELYTAGLYDRIAPQDAYKSPVDLSLAIQGALKEVSQVGYNVSFVYPEEGLNALARRMSDQCAVQYGKRVVRIDTSAKELFFDSSSRIEYDTLISTLPLNKTLEMTDIELGVEPDPYTSVLVLNIGAVRGRECPDDHWLYTPDANSGFHRIGFYSNVDSSFLPISYRKEGNRVGIYVERSYLPGSKPSDRKISQYTDDVVEELQEWNFIGDVEVADPTWIDVAYTWSWPGSSWKQKALEELEGKDIHQVGRYGRWTFQGIADSIRDGLYLRAAMK